MVNKKDHSTESMELIAEGLLGKVGLLLLYPHLIEKDKKNGKKRF